MSSPGEEVTKSIVPPSIGSSEDGDPEAATATTPKTVDTGERSKSTLEANYSVHQFYLGTIIDLAMFIILKALQSR